MPETQASAAQVSRAPSIVGPLIGLAVILGVVTLNATTTGAVLPRVVIDLHQTLAQLSWAVTGLIVAQGACIVPAGWLADRFGMRRSIQGAVVLFCLALAMTGIAPNGQVFVVSFIMQGAAAGVLVPLSLYTAYRFVSPDQRSSIIAILGIALLVVPVLSLIVEKPLFDAASWRVLFLVEIPICALGAAVCSAALPRDRGKTGHTDRAGLVLGPAAGALLLYGLTSSDQWSTPSTDLGLAGGSVLLLLFIVVEWQAVCPLVDIRALGTVTVGLVVACQGLARVAFGVGTFLLPLLLSQLRGYDDDFRAPLFIVV